MAKKDKKIWSNGWIIGTGTGILSVILLRVFDGIANTKILFTIWGFIKSIITSTGDFFKRNFSFPLWGLILLSCSGLLVLFLIAWISSLFQKKEIINTDPPFLNYTSDKFDSIVYKWEYVKDAYSDKKYRIVHFTPYCPKDNCIIHYSRCPICNTYYGNIKENHELEILVRHRVENELYSH